MVFSVKGSNVEITGTMLTQKCSGRRRRQQLLFWFVGFVFHLHHYKVFVKTNHTKAKAKGRTDCLPPQQTLIANRNFHAMDMEINMDRDTDVCRDIRLLCKEGQLKEALHLLRFMSRPDFSTYSSLLHACLKSKALPEAKLVHAHMMMIDTRFQADVITASRLVSVYAKCGNLVNGRRVLAEIVQPNAISWNAMIAAYSRHGHDEESLTLFCQMQQTGISPDHFTLATVLSACGSLEALKWGKEIHEAAIRSSFQSDVFVGSALVDMYIKCYYLEDARKVFDRMPVRDVVSWNAMMAGYAQNGHVHEALKFFQEMPEQNVISWNVMISGYAQNGHVDEALELFRKMPKRDIVSWTTMLAGFVQSGRVDEAVEHFEKMPERNVVSWSTMIAGYAQNGHADEALELYKQMLLAGVKPNPVTFSGVLPACSNLSVLKNGKQVHEDIFRRGFESNIFLRNALIDMYAKCGEIEDAQKVFDKMSTRNVVSWTAMIVGYAIHGYGTQALQAFEQMQLSGIKPNNVTLIGVLSACCHAGLVDDGWQYFNGMSEVYNITPTVEHYCCMVDILGRAGHLDAARDFIAKMPMQPDAAVWRTLLGACRLHTDIALAEHVVQYLIELDSKNAAHYVLLSNIYASSGRWDDAKKVRKLMKDRRIEKAPGCSWIDINNKTYSFLVGDRSHPETQKIYAVLETLSAQIKEAGYVPNTDFVLHDVEEEQKEHIIHYHSEKLAIAFGLISIPPGMPIRIVKNLRVCGDCHIATKFISRIVEREIIVRDANRFHHFKDGQCSCGDYW